MILSNFILSFTLNNNYFENHLLKQSNNIFKNSYIATKIYSKKYFVLLASNNREQYEGSQLSENSIPFKHFVYPNLWQKFLNKYLQETIFLSPVNNFNNSYINLLKKRGLCVYDSSQNRIFLNKFSRDLINGKINVRSTDGLIKTLSYQDFVYLKYSWSKMLYQQILKFVHFRKNIVSFFLRDKLFFFNNSIPLFVLTNDNNEIIMSESVNQLSKLGHLSTFHGTLIPKLFSNVYSSKSYTCLIFVNPYDAMEYRDFLKYKNSWSTNSLNVKIAPSNLRLYFRLKSFFANSVDFRLVPDLQEVSDLLFKYSKYRNVSFDENQKYGSNFFQGQPLYKIKDVNFRRIKKDPSLDTSIYLFTREKEYNNLNTFFLNYDTAHSAWKKFREENNNTKLPKDPQISVSNVELFINNCAKEKEISKIIFLPSLETYKFIKEYLVLNFKNQYNFSHWLSNKSLVMKTICYRIFWSLASRQPNNL